MGLDERGRNQLYLGVDGGGSKCRAILYTPTDGILGVGLSGSANPIHNCNRAIDSIVESSAQAIENAKLPQSVIHEAVVGLGLAGVNLPQYFHQLMNWKHPYKSRFITTDLHVACVGAHEGNDGAVIIAGTGSCGFSSVNGERLILGAHGFPHGDKGSGAWVGLQAITHCLLVMDGFEEKSALLDKVGCNDPLALIEKVAGKPPKTFAKYAPLVFDAADEGDETAIRIISEGAGYITELAKKLWASNPPRMSLIGGLTPRLLPWIEPEIASRFSPPLEQPEMGAVYFALQSFQKKVA